MSDLFTNMMQRRRHGWHYNQQPADVASTTANRISRSRRSATPAASSPLYEPKITRELNIDNDLDIDDDDDTSDDDDKKRKQQDAADAADDDNDPLANILSLKLRKPSNWKWELTTSKSCSNIALPRILLYDHKGNLLVDSPAGGNGSSEQVYKQDDYERPRQRDKTKKRPYNHQRAATTNLTHSVRKALEKEFDGLQIEEVSTSTPKTSERKFTGSSLLTTPSSTTSTNTTMRPHRSRKAIELNTADLPDLSRRSSSLKGVRFNVEDENPVKIPEFLPTPPSTTTPTSSSSGPREKRKYRRSHSSGRSSTRSESILERISYQKGRYSSPESEEDQRESETGGPRYFLRTDEAGTLTVHEDSFSSQNTRRRRRSQKYLSSAESINKSESPLSLAASPTLNTPSETSTTPSTRERRRKLLPVRRYLSDGNILLNKHLSSSDDEKVVETVVEEKEDDVLPDPVPAPTPSSGGACNCKHHRRYRRNETKDLNPSISPVGQQRNGKIR